VASDPRYISVVPGVQSTLVVPLRNKGAVIGALNLLSSDRDAFDDTDEAMLRAFAAPIAQAIVNARLFESEREYSETMATLAEVGREMSGILDLDELLTRVAHLVKRVIAYRTFGIALLNDDSGMIEFKVAISYGEASASASMKIGEGLLGYAVQHKEVVLAPDVAKDPRYINAVPDAKSELRAARADGAAAARAAEAHPRRRRIVAVRAGPRARRRPLRVPRAGAESAHRRRG
jgi:sigma-B regulation protein RsbU (phosphoserine phosphatase)